MANSSVYMAKNKYKYSKFIEHRYLRAVLKRKFYISFFDLNMIIAALRPVHFKNFISYEKSFFITDNIIIHAKDLKNYGCRYYIEEIQS